MTVLSAATPVFFHDPRSWVPWVVLTGASLLFVAIIVAAAEIANHRDAVRKDRNVARPETPAEVSDPGPSRGA